MLSPGPGEERSSVFLGVREVTITHMFRHLLDPACWPLNYFHIFLYSFTITLPEKVVYAFLPFLTNSSILLLL